MIMILSGIAIGAVPIRKRGRTAGNAGGHDGAIASETGQRIAVMQATAALYAVTQSG